MPDATNTKRSDASGCRRKPLLLLCRQIGVFLLIAAGGLTGCRLGAPASQAATPTQAQPPIASPYPYPQVSTPFQPQAPTSYPPPVSEPLAANTSYPEPESQEFTAAAPYPAPSGTPIAPASPTQPAVEAAMLTASAQPYPLPASPIPLESPATAYPGPQSTAAATATPITYPGPQPTATQSALLEQASPTSPSYPGPALTPTPVTLATQPVSLTPAGTAAGTIVVTTPTPTLSPTVVRTVFRPSDPSDFTLISDRPQFITFYAEWAPDSQVMAPVIYNLEGRYGNRVGFVYLDLENAANSIFKEMLKSDLPPAFFLLNPQGGMVGHWSGRVEFDVLDNAIRSISP